jgi:hypothetical protein
MLEGAQTFSGLKTFSAGVAITGGTAATQRLTVSGTTWTVGNGPTITEAGAATFATSVTSPTIVGGSSVSQVLTIKSTTGIGTSDRIDFTVGNNGAITGLRVGTVGQVTAGPTGSVSTSLQHVLNLPNANSYTNITSTGVNSIRLAASANTNAIISGRSTTNNIAGLAFVAGTADTNSVADMYFQVLENDNTDFATQTNLAYAWYNGAGAIIMSATRAGAWAAGPNASTNLNLAVNGRASVTHGLTFPAAANLSADVNTLDDYEEGTWTPSLVFAVPGTGQTYGASRFGNYQKIGNRVYFNCYFVLSAKGTGTGQVQITGLPFTPVAQSSGGLSSCSIWTSGLSRANYMLTAYVDAPNAQISLNGTSTTADAAGAVGIDNNHVSGTASVMISGFYITAS